MKINEESTDFNAKYNLIITAIKDLKNSNYSFYSTKLINEISQVVSSNICKWDLNDSNSNTLTSTQLLQAIKNEIKLTIDELTTSRFHKHFKGIDYAYERYNDTRNLDRLLQGFTNNSIVLDNEDNLIVTSPYFGKDALGFTLNKDGLLKSNTNLKDIIDNKTLPINLEVYYNSDSIGYFNGSRILKALSFLRFCNQCNYLNYYAINLNECYVKWDSSYNLLTDAYPSNPIIFNENNKDYVEFRELIEYCILSYIPNLQKEYSLHISYVTKQCKKVIYVELFSERNTKIKTKYADFVEDFVKHLINRYGLFTDNGIDLYINAKDEVISPIDKAKMLGNYQQKYGTISDIHRLIRM